MPREKLLEKLYGGEYHLDTDENCDCLFEWRQDGAEDVALGDGTRCWTAAVLMVDGETVAEWTTDGGFASLTDALKLEDFQDDILDGLRLMAAPLKKGEHGERLSQFESNDKVPL